MFLQFCSYYRYDTTENRWIVVDWFASNKNEQHVQTPTDSTTIKVATFNVLFDQNELDEPVVRSKDRFHYQLHHLLPSLDCDVLILQEVTTLYLGNLLKQQWVVDNYHYCSSFSRWTEKNPEFTKRKSGTRNIILSRLPITEMYSVHTGIGDQYTRSLLAVVSTPVTTFTVCAVHLKACQQFVDARKEQLDDLFQFFGILEKKHKFFSNEEPTEVIHRATRDERNKIIIPKSNPLNTSFREFNNVILAGDFNMLQECEESFIPDTVRDIWKMLRPNEPGFTMDPTKNNMADKMSRPIEGSVYTPQVRFDRMFLLPCAGNVNMEALSIEMFGDTCVPLEDTNDVFSSDHFGLKSEIQISRTHE
jgi:endonuclease/exonuclease/phosphatase family metal-dependent hydrolase